MGCKVSSKLLLLALISEHFSPAACCPQPSWLGLAALVLAFAAPGVDAQEEETANRVYTAYYQVGWGDLMEWIG